MGSDARVPRFLEAAFLAVFATSLASGVLSGSIPTGTISALVALGWWLAEAVALAVSTLGAYALIPLGLEYVGAGTPASSYHQTLGTLFLGVDQNAAAIHMLFFCLGAIMRYYLMFQSRVVPRALSLWGLVAVFPMLVAMLLIL